ncbi:hypothetical protein LMG23992_02269 [Cupriavidus laharis]|uniref:Uncharacterized protein n=1 Tax=Cupriavidus laharis TaxID=151654 RepID=A0ABM8WYC4_9BURK|nr:hypothetical protein [Cupriavidus laharis]CAG9172568.1 hypothetical protein LMG23992_02269 [Cupriavidus laharis]
MFGLFGKRKSETALDEFIRLVYGDPPPAKRAKLAEAIELARELLMEVVSVREIAITATELNSGPIPYSTHDLAISTALNYFKREEWIPRLSTAQLSARIVVLGWLQEGKVAPLLVQSFEDTLYRLYKR